MKNKIVPAIIVLLIVFLAGFVPQFVKANRLERELRAARQENGLCGVRDLLAEMYVQANERNYGLAAGTSATFFNRVRELANQTADANSRSSLESILAFRDAVTAKLAKGDAGVMSDLQALFVKMRDTALGRQPAA